MPKPPLPASPIDDDEIEPPALTHSADDEREWRQDRNGRRHQDEQVGRIGRPRYRDPFAFGRNEIETLVMRLDRRMVDLAGGKADADGVDRPFAAQRRARARSVMLGAMADAIAAPIEGDQRHEERRSGSTAGASRSGFGLIPEPAGDQQFVGQRQRRKTSAFGAAGWPPARASAAKPARCNSPSRAPMRRVRRESGNEGRGRRSRSASGGRNRAQPRQDGRRRRAAVDESTARRRSKPRSRSDTLGPAAG